MGRPGEKNGATGGRPGDTREPASGHQQRGQGSGKRHGHVGKFPGTREGSQARSQAVSSADTAGSATGQNGQHAAQEPPPDPVPELLRAQPRWIVARADKKPIPGQAAAQSVYWVSYEVARKRLADAGDSRSPDRPQLLGFSLYEPVPIEDTSDDALVALDFDNCIKRDGALTFGDEWIEAMNSYTEVSPSGTGLRVFVIAPLSEALKVAGKTMVEGPLGVQKADRYGKDPQIEVIVGGEGGNPKYVTVTGDVFDGRTEIRRVENFNWLASQRRVSKAAAAKQLETGMVKDTDKLTDEQIIERLSISAAVRLGNWKSGDYKSASEAYWRLVHEVLHACRRDGERTIEFLLGPACGLWAAGAVESVDPGKFAKREWVENNVLRATGKTEGERAEFSADHVVVDEQHEPAPDDEEMKAKPLHVDDLLVDYRAIARQMRTTDRFKHELVPHFLERGRVINVGAGPKTGKTTLIHAVLCGFALDDPLPFDPFGKPLRPLRSLLCSENPASFDSMQIDAMLPHSQCSEKRVELVTKTELSEALREAGHPPIKTFETMLAVLERIVAAKRMDVVLLDTFDAWVPNAEDTNNATEVQRNVGMAADWAAKLGIAVINVLHMNKSSDGKLDFTGFLGSTKFRGVASNNFVMKRVSEDSDLDRRIELRHEGRHDLAFIHRLLGRLPDAVSREVRERYREVPPSRLCYEPVADEVESLDGESWVRIRYERRPMPKGDRSTPIGDAQIELVIVKALQLREADGDTSPIGIEALTKPKASYVERAIEALGVPMKRGGGTRPGLSKAEVMRRAEGLTGRWFEWVKPKTMGKAKGTQQGFQLTAAGRAIDCANPPFEGLGGEVDPPADGGE